MGPDGVLDAAHEAHAGVGLFFHDGFSGRYGMTLCCLNYSIEIGVGQAILWRRDRSGRCARAGGRQQAGYAVKGNMASTIAEEARR
jgi:hypothetical protein